MPTVVSLEPGANVSLTGSNPLLRDVVVGFGWQIQHGNGPATELVASAVLCDANNRALSDDHFVFFNQLVSPDGSVTYIENDDQEQLDINLPTIPDAVAKIVFIVYVDPDLRRPGNFGAVRDAYVHVDDRDGNTIARYNVQESNSQYTAMIFGELYRHNGAWKFRAGGQGYAGGLAAVAKDYGVEL